MYTSIDSIKALLVIRFFATSTLWKLATASLATQPTTASPYKSRPGEVSTG